MKRAAPLQHAAAAGCRGGPHGTAAACGLLVIFLLSLLCYGCDAQQQQLVSSRSLLDSKDSDATTLTADNTCLKNVVNKEQTVYYPVDTARCHQDPVLGLAFVEVEARIFQQCADDHHWAVFVNTDGRKVPVVNSSSVSNNTDTFVDFIGSEDYRLRGHLDIPIGQNISQEWVVGFYSSCGPVQYSLKAWCSATRGCDLSCSDPDSGPCVSLEKCRCTWEADEGCDVDVDSLPEEEDIVSRYGFSHHRETIPHGTWRYFRFQAFLNMSRTMVELDRAYGDLVLFLKPDTSSGTSDDDTGLTGRLPIEQDAYKFADVLSFQNRLSHHARFVNGSGKFFVGVYNADACLEEDSTFNLTVTTVVSSDNINLCPLNCSYPQGLCVADDVCRCEAGFGGQYCGGTVSAAVPRRSYTGQLQPGEWAYINMTSDMVSSDVDVSVSFSYSTGHPILLAQQNGFPTLTDFRLKFSNSTLGPTPNATYRISGASVILGIFNVDYMNRAVTDFELVIIGDERALAIWVIILAAVGSSMFLLSLALTIRHMIQKRGQHPAGLRMGMDFEATPQDLEMVEHRHQDTLMISTLPLLAFQNGLVPKEDAGCSICLNSYNEGEIVCRLPGCKHVFHVRCLEEWFRNDSSCPLCRVPLQDQGIETSPDPPVHPTSSLLASSSG